MRITKKQSVNIDSIGVPILLLTFDKSFKNQLIILRKLILKRTTFWIL